jgi:serine phosphatase RsbU (regulator of sigma subunit)
MEAESEEGGYFGQERLTNNLRATRRVPLEDSINSLITRVTKWCGDSSPQDDITIVAFEIGG